MRSCESSFDIARQGMTFKSYMHIALQEARAAASRGEIPVGAVIVDAAGGVVAQAGNRTHDLYVTLEPCSMCAGMIAAARIRRLYYGAADQKSGGVGQGPRVFSHPQSHHSPEVFDGIDGAECAALLKSFFSHLR
jgi:tRNA(adenine34) deaminase